MVSRKRAEARKDERRTLSGPWCGCGSVAGCAKRDPRQERGGLEGVPKSEALTRYGETEVCSTTPDRLRVPHCSDAASNAPRSCIGDRRANEPPRRGAGVPWCADVHLEPRILTSVSSDFIQLSRNVYTLRAS